VRILFTSLALAMLLRPAAAQDAAVRDAAGEALLFDMRAPETLLFGTGADSASGYYDVPITRQANQGVLIKLGYTERGGELTFDLHHRVGLSDEFGLPAEIMTVVEVITGASNRLGTYTLLSTVGEDARSDEVIDRASDAEVDRYVTPLGRKSVTIRTDPGPQSISIVGRDLTITRGGLTTRVDTPGTRIAMVSNVRFEEVRQGETLTFDEQD